MKIQLEKTNGCAEPTRQKGVGLNLRAGEWVEVRDAAGIMATLDDTQCLEGLPFMPEMLQYCGKRFRVFKSAHKTCDTIAGYMIRRMANTVHLEGLRCDGEAHAGCQAACLLFWKDAWLERVEAGGVAPSSKEGSDQRSCDVSSLHLAARVPMQPGETQERFRCQATELLKATTAVRRRDRWDPRFYLKDLTSGNVKFSEFVWYGTVAMLNSFALMLGWRRYPHLCGRAGEKTPSVAVNLQPGELVQVRSKDAIMETLNVNLRNRGLYFDVEMVPYCEAGNFQVLGRVERIVDEKTGYMIKLPTPSLILDGVTCSGNLSLNRMFCPRAIYPYWRQAWLKRIDQQNENGHDASASS